MNGNVFTSAFASRIESYLAFKASMGFTGTSRIWYLKQFDKYCSSEQATVFDRETVEGWVVSRLETSGQYRSWMSYIRDFGRWLHANGDVNAYVLSERWRAKFVPAHPYLLSRDEIQTFFQVAPSVKSVTAWAWQATSFFVLMYACGMRTGEVRHLTREHVNVHAQHIDVLWSKGNRSRRLPITPEIVALLEECDKKTDEVFPGRETFFISGAGTQVTSSAVGVIFNRIWDQAGLLRVEGGKQPRPYDFRHHFAYANIERWMREDIDIVAQLPYLSRYMGHTSFDSTFYYVHTSPDFMNDYTHIVQDSTHILPKVGFEGTWW